MRILAFTISLILTPLLLSAQSLPVVEGSFVCLGYDKTLSFSHLGSIEDRLDNGVLFNFNTQNVQLDIEAGVWNAEILILGTTPVQQSLPISSCLYYPEVPWGQLDTHQWLVGDYTISNTMSAALLTVIGYDGTIRVTGDLFSPQKDNDGMLFSLGINSPHIISGKGGSVVHGGLFIYDFAGVQRFQWVVYPMASVILQPISIEALGKICNCVP